MVMGGGRGTCVDKRRRSRCAEGTPRGAQWDYVACPSVQKLSPCVTQHYGLPGGWQSPGAVMGPLGWDRELRVTVVVCRGEMTCG